jgi:His/Glu/Gln/Arg/opine family amino acid ABC transporter permease subunit
MARYMINLDLIRSALPHLLHGAWVSLQIAGLALALGFTGGTLLGILQTGNSKLIKWIIAIYTTIIRGTPMLIQIVFLYYVVSMLGINFSAFTTAVIAIGLNSSAYISQIIRSGINAVPRGQIEAAQTLGISKTDTLKHIILPEAVRVVLPALGNESITLIKDSSLASWIGVVELYKEGQTIISQTYDALSIYCATAALYLIMTMTLSYIVSKLEKYVNRHVTN